MSESEQAKIVSLEIRLQALVKQHASDRGDLAKQLSQLLEENEQLKLKIKQLENTQVVTPIAQSSTTFEHLTFDFGLPESS